MKNDRILVIAAHPDDDVLGMGGTMAKYRSKGVEVNVAFIAEGTTCRYDSIDHPDANSQLDIRKHSALSALKILDVGSVTFFDLPCGRLDTVPILEINKKIEGLIKKYKPTVVYTHSPKDVNHDHRIVSRSVEMATRPIPNSEISKIIFFEVLSSSEWVLSPNDVFFPNTYEVLSESQIEKKCLALREYFTEIKSWPFSRSDEGVLTLAKYRGMQVGERLAEAFIVSRSIIQ